MAAGTLVRGSIAAGSSFRGELVREDYAGETVVGTREGSGVRGGVSRLLCTNKEMLTL